MAFSVEDKYTSKLFLVQNIMTQTDFSEFILSGMNPLHPISVLYSNFVHKSRRFPDIRLQKMS